MAAEYGWARFNSFSEGNASPIALENVSYFSAYAAYVEAGARLFGVFSGSGWLLQHEVVVSYARNFRNSPYEVPLRLVQIPGCEGCNFQGLEPVTNLAQLQFGGVLYLGKRVQIGLRGNVQGGNHWYSAGGNLQLSVGF